MAKILIIEDDNDLREMYETRLTYEGFKVCVCDDGKNAVAITQKEMPDLILLDIMIPNFSGFEVLELLKKNTETKNIPVIIMTVLDQESNKIKGLELGAEDYISKAKVMPDEVIEKVEKMLSKS